MDSRWLGTVVIVVGLSLALLGLLIRVGAFSWFGKLPGDISYKNEHVGFYFPLVSMLLLSVLLSLALYLIRRFF